LGATIGQNIFVAILIMALFNNAGTGVSGIQNRLGVFFFMTLNLTFGIIAPSIGKFPGNFYEPNSLILDQKRLIKRERAAGSYRSSSAYLSKLFSGVPLIFVGNLILGIPVYWVVGLSNTASQFFTYLFIIFVQSLVANCLGYLIGSAAPNVTVGQIMMPLIIIVFMLFGGLLVNLDSITVVLRWVQWISLISYTYKCELSINANMFIAFALNEFTSNLKFDCSTNSTQCFPDGGRVVKAFALDALPLWTLIGLNIVLGFSFVFLGMFVFRRTSAPLSKLK
jgi:ABC-2 type transporter